MKTIAEKLQKIIENTKHVIAENEAIMEYIDIIIEKNKKLLK
jgi:hypothetical protein